MNISDYNLDKEDLEFVIDLLISFSRGTEIEIDCLGKEYFIESVKGGISARNVTDDLPAEIFTIPEFFFERFMIEGKPFIERIGDITDFAIF